MTDNFEKTDARTYENTCPGCAAKDAEIYGAVSIMQGVRSILGDYMTNRNIDKSVRQGMRAFLKRHEEGKREYDHAQALKASRAAVEEGGQCRRDSECVTCGIEDEPWRFCPYCGKPIKPGGE